MYKKFEKTKVSIDYPWQEQVQNLSHVFKIPRCVGPRNALLMNEIHALMDLDHPHVASWWANGWE